MYQKVQSLCFQLNNESTWDEILKGNLTVIPNWEVFIPPFDINQMDLNTLNSHRPIHQSQSFNLFFKTPSDLKYISDTIFDGWEKGVKTYYYHHSEAKSITKNFNNTNVDAHLQSDNNQVLTNPHGIVCEGCE